MTRLLYIQSSPRGVESKSLSIAETYLAALQSQHPAIEVDTIKLWGEDLPSFGPLQASAKMKVMTGRSPESAEIPAWEEITRIANRFIDADAYLFAAPMWNGGIPYRLKHYIDIIHQPRLTWGLDPKTGFFGLLKNKHATVILTSGAYAPNSPPGFGADHHSTYMHDWLAQAGVTDIDEVRFQPTLLTADPAGGLEKAKQAARELAARYAKALAN